MTVLGPGGRFARLFRETAFYTIGSAVNHTAKLFLLPVYARMLSKPEYGRLEQAFIDIALTDILISFALQTSLLRLHFDYQDARDRRRLFAAAFVVLGGLAVVHVLVRGAWNFANIGPDLPMTWLIVPYVLLSNITAMTLTAMRVHRRPGWFLATTASGTLAEVAGVIVALTWLGREAEFAVTGILAGELVVAALAFTFLLRPLLEFTTERAFYVNYLRFAAPIVVTQLIGWLLVSFDRLMMRTYFGLADLAVLGVALQAASLLKLGIEGGLNALNVVVYSRMDTLRAHYADAMGAGIAAICLLACAFAVLRHTVVGLLAGPAYESAADVLAWLMPSRVLMLANVLMGWVLFYRKDTRFYTISSGLAAVVAVVCGLTLVPSMKFAGAAMSAVAIYGLTTTLLAWRTSRHGIPTLTPATVLLVVGLSGVVVAATRLQSATLIAACVTAYLIATIAYGVTCGRRVVAALEPLRS